MSLQLLPGIICIPEASLFTPDSAAGLIETSDDLKQINRALNVIFDLSHRIAVVIKGTIHPGLVNLNAPSQDAVQVKHDKATQAEWLASYYRPFHQQIEQACRDRAIKIGLDCHIFDDDQASPVMVSLCNQGNYWGGGMNVGNPLTCPTDILRDLLDVTTAVFSKYDQAIAVNPKKQPSYIIEHYSNERLPWIRIGFSRSLILGGLDRLFDHHIQKLQEQMQSLITYLFKVEEWMD